MKNCSTCGVDKNPSEYHKDVSQKDGLAFYCIVCRKKSARLYYNNNKDRFYSYNSKWKKANPGKVRATSRALKLKYNFNITVSDYDKMMLAQGGVCAICSGTNKDGRRLHVDHDHSTGAIRGLLCGRCNPAIGLFDDSIEVISKAVDYLKRLK